MARLSLSLIIFSVCLTASPVYLIVPPKTPAISGFQPAAVGTNRDLVCDAYQPDAGTITYTWYKYKPPDSQGRTWETSRRCGTGQKFIFNPVSHIFYYNFPFKVGPETTSGKYKCRASNSAGTRDSDWGHLYVYTPCSQYTVSVSPAISVVGSTFTANCYIPNPSGFAVFWTKQTDISSPVFDAGVANSNGCHAPNNTRFTWSSCSPPSLSSKTNTFNLQITNAQPSDFAYWICKDIGLNCTSDPVKPVVLAQNGIPQITGFPTDPVVAGAQVNLTCVASPPGDSYDWYKNGTKLTTSLSYDLHVKKESAGVYKCVARNATGSATSSDKTLVVYYKPDSLVLSSRKTSCHTGEKDRFTCTATGGSPTPFKKSILNANRPFWQSYVHTDSDNVMTKWDNQAEFYCNATVFGFPALNMTSNRITYDVTFPNTKVSFINNPKAAVQVGQVKKFTCKTDESHPVTSIKWYQSVNGSSWQDVTSGITSSERNGTYGGKIRISEWSVTATTAMNGRTVRCVSFYSLTGHRLTVSADTTMRVGNVGMIAGVVASVVVLVAIIVVIVVIMKRRNKACFSGIVYTEVRPDPEERTAPKEIGDLTVAEFKQWLLSKEVTESTYKVLAKNGFNKAAIFVLIEREEDIKGLNIKPLGQEVLVQNLAKSFHMIGAGEGRQDAGDCSGDRGARDDMET